MSWLTREKAVKETQESCKDRQPPVWLTEASVLRAKLTPVFPIKDVDEQALMYGGFLMDRLK